MQIQSRVTGLASQQQIDAFLPNICSGIKIIADEEPGTAPAFVIVRIESWYRICHPGENIVCRSGNTNSETKSIKISTFAFALNSKK